MTPGGSAAVHEYNNGECNMSDNPLTIKSFAEWIDKNRHPGQWYDYDDWTTCACGQYAKHLGIADWYTNSSRFWNRANQMAYIYPRTFGELALRLHTIEGYDNG